MKKTILPNIYSLATLFCLLLVVSCGKLEVQSICLKNCAQNSLKSSVASPMTLSNFQTSNVSSDTFDVSFDLSGDNNQNGEVSIYYCSVKNTPACNPETDGVQSPLTRNETNFLKTINLGQASISPGDIVKYKTEANDSDGLSGGSEAGYITVPHGSTPRAISQLGFISKGTDSSLDETVTASVLDSSGNIFVTGNTLGSLGEANAGGDDAYIAKFNSTGILQWISQLGNITIGANASGDDFTYSIALDSSGNIFITGYTSGSLGETNGGGYDAYVAKFNSSGFHQWTKQLGSVTVGAGASGDDLSRGLSLDSSGNIFIVGHTTGNLGEANAGGKDAFVSKLNSSGILQWTSQLGNITAGAGASNDDISRSLSLDGSGNIFISGHTQGNLDGTSSGNGDAFIVKFNSSGVKQWISQIGTTGEDSSYAIALDSSGNIIIVGNTDATMGELNAGSNDAYISKFNSSGVHQWTTQLGLTTAGAGSASSNEIATALVLDDSNNIFISGYTLSSLGEANAGSWDAFIAKFNSAGTYQWSSQLGNVTIGAGASKPENVRSVNVDSSGNIFIAGRTQGALSESNNDNWDAFISKFNSSGIHQWTNQVGITEIGTGASGSEYIGAMDLDSLGNTIIAGYTDGAIGEANAGGQDAIVAKISSSGELQWTSQLGITTANGSASGDEQVNAMIVDGGDNILIAGITTGNMGEVNSGLFDAFISKFNNSGVHQWTSQLGNVTAGAAASGDEQVRGIAVDSPGNIFIAGQTQGALGEANAGNKDIFIAKFNSSGALQWIKQLGNVTSPTTASGDDYVNALKIYGSDLYITGYTSGSLAPGETNGGGYDSFIAKFDNDGVLQWIRQLGNTTIGAGASGNDYASAISLGGPGDIFITGDTTGSLDETNGGGQDVFISKFDSNGAHLWTSQLGSSTLGVASASNDYSKAITLISGAGDIFIAGDTLGSLGEANAGGSDGFIAKFDSSGAYKWSSQLGNVTMGTNASESDYLRAINIDSSGNILVAGETFGGLGEENGGNKDIFIAKFNSDGTLTSQN